MPTGILGGTFDPPHKAHLALALAALDTGQVDRVLLVPAKSPPHKQRTDMLPPKIRLEMTHLLASADPRIDVSDIELRRGGDSYTVLTIRELCRKFPDEHFRLIIGADMALIFGTWVEAGEIIRIAPPLIAARPGFEFPDGFGLEFPHELTPQQRQTLASGVFHMPLQDVSSTFIRENIRTAEASEMLTPEVLSYIRRNCLYA